MNDEQASAGMVPLDVLFAHSEYNGVLVSPDGRHLACLAPCDGVLNVWLRAWNDPSTARPLTTSCWPVRYYWWAWNNRQLIWRADQAGDEHFQYFATDIDSGRQLVLSPAEVDGRRIRAWGSGTFMNWFIDPSSPDEVLLLTNELSAGRLDAWRVSLVSGKRRMVQEGLPGVQRWLADHALRIRGYLRGESGGATSLHLREADSGEFNERLRFDPDDFTCYMPIQFNAGNNSLYFLDATGRDTTALVEFDSASGARRMLAVREDVDAGPYVLFHPQRHNPLAVGFYRDRLEWCVLDSQFAAVLKKLSADEHLDAYAAPGSEHLWPVIYAGSAHPWRGAIYDSRRDELHDLGSSAPQLEKYRWQEAQPLRIRARDGLELQCYLTQPAAARLPGPLVLLVHGGPSGRDCWYFDETVQWLASRGWACLQVNFRGSTGFGKRFRAAGDGQWGAAMQDDLIDAVGWAAADGVADPTRIAIMGESYGGFAVLAGLTLTSELYAAGIALNPVCDLESHLRHWDAMRPAWRAMTERREGRLPRYSGGERDGQFKDEMDWTAEERAQVEDLRRRSPLWNVQRLRAPLLIGQGAGDTRTPESNTTPFVTAAREAGAEVEYVVYSGEGHWMASPASYIDFHQRAERLLARTLGGRCEQQIEEHAG